MFVVGAVTLAESEAALSRLLAPGVALALAFGALFRATRPPSASYPVRPRDVFLAVTLAWNVAALLGTIPLVASGAYANFTATFFETMSAFTTTGATTLDEIEPLSAGVLLWRSVMQWLGGLGIVMLFVAIAPAVGTGATRVLFAEVGGPAKERITPRISDTARVLWTVYLVLTGSCLLAYWIAGMSAFDAVNHAMTTVATGGFSTRTASIGAFDSVAIELVSIVFMAAGGVSFALYWQLAVHRRITRLQLLEFLSYLAAVLVFAAIVATSLVSTETGSLDWSTVRDAMFAVVTVVTTTGYVTADFDEWTSAARVVILFTMFVGGCAGSTAGGIKIIRWMILGAALRSQERKMLHPSAVAVVRVGGRVFSERVVAMLLVFLVAYMLLFALGAGVVAAGGADLTTAISASASSLNLIGPALGEAGAAESYGSISDTGLWMLALLMLMGRLEVFTVLVLIMPSFWRSR